MHCLRVAWWHSVTLVPKTCVTFLLCFLSPPLLPHLLCSSQGRNKRPQSSRYAVFVHVCAHASARAAPALLGRLPCIAVIVAVAIRTLGFDDKEKGNPICSPRPFSFHYSAFYSLLAGTEDLRPLRSELTPLPFGWTHHLIHLSVQSHGCAEHRSTKAPRASSRPLLDNRN